MFAVLRVSRVGDGLPVAVLIGGDAAASSPHFHVQLAGRTLPILLLQEAMEGGVLQVGRKTYARYENIAGYDFYSDSHPRGADAFSLTFTARSTNLIFKAEGIFAADFKTALLISGVDSSEHYERKNGITYFLGTPVKNPTIEICHAVAAYEKNKLHGSPHH